MGGKSVLLEEPSVSADLDVELQRAQHIPERRLVRRYNRLAKLGLDGSDDLDRRQGRAAYEDRLRVRPVHHTRHAKDALSRNAVDPSPLLLRLAKTKAVPGHHL